MTGRAVCCAYATPYATRQSQGKRLSLCAFKCALSGDTESAIVSVSGSFTPAPRRNLLCLHREQKAAQACPWLGEAPRRRTPVFRKSRLKGKHRHGDAMRLARDRVLLALLAAALSKSASTAPARCGLRGQPHDPNSVRSASRRPALMSVVITG